MAAQTVKQRLEAARKKAQGGARATPSKKVQITARIAHKDWLTMCGIRSHAGMSHQDQIIYGLALFAEKRRRVTHCIAWAPAVASFRGWHRLNPESSTFVVASNTAFPVPR